MIEANIILYTLVFARLAALMLTVPFFGGNAVPVRIRALLAAALAVLVMPLQWNAQAVRLDGMIQYAVLLGAEAIIGACLGLGVMILLHGMTLAGGLIGQASGISLADVIDPSLDENSTQFSQLLFLTTVCVFLCLGGHRTVMGGLLETFRVIPPGGGRILGSLSDVFVTLTQQSFSLGIRAAAPAVTALLLATLILGAIGRTLPQGNILTVGFGMHALLAIAVAALTLGAAIWAFQDELPSAMETIFSKGLEIRD